MLRCNLPYRQVRSFGPPGPGDAARDRAGLKNAIVRNGRRERGVPHFSPQLREVGMCRQATSPDLFLAGHSYGGRQSSMLCAEEPDLVSGLLLLSYPLHPPRKPEQQRTQHLPDLHTPTLFVQRHARPLRPLSPNWSKR